MAINVANTGANLSGDTLLTQENTATITAAHTFDRDPSAPFVVTSGSAVVTNLDADKVDGLHAADIAGAAVGTIQTVSAVWTFTTNPVFNANAIPETAIADGAVLTRVAGTETVTGTWTFDSRSKIKAGSATSLKASLGGVIYSVTNVVGNVGAGEDTLYTQSVPASTLATDGDGLVITAYGGLVSSGDTKTIRLKWGSTTIHTVTSTTGTTGWHLRARIGRRGATAQVCSSFICANGTSSVSIAATAETLSGAVTLAVTGEGVNNNDITVEQISVHFEPVSV